MLKYYLFAGFIFVFTGGFAAIKAAQDNRFKEDSLFTYGNNFVFGESDSVRLASNSRFRDLLFDALDKGYNPARLLDSLKHVSMLRSNNKSVIVYTWYVPSLDRSRFLYSGIISVYDHVKKETFLTILSDKTSEIEDAENVKLNPDKWFGALYYGMTETQAGSKTFYTLLGWKGNDRFSTKKVIDVMTIGKSKPTFGEPVFRNGKTIKSRIIFEYNVNAVMSLKYDERMKMIVFDHLSPPTPQMKDIFSTYGPDFSYDAYQFRGGKWNYKMDVDARNPEKKIKKTGKKKPEQPMYKRD